MKLANFLFFIKSLHKTKKESHSGTLGIATEPVGSPQEPSGAVVTARSPAQDALCLISSRKSNEIKRHIVLLRRLGTAGVYPFQSSAMTFNIPFSAYILSHFLGRCNIFQNFIAPYHTRKILLPESAHKPPAHSSPALWQRHLPLAYPRYGRSHHRQ